MHKEFKFPDIGFGIAEGKLVKWLAAEGDQIQKSQCMFYIETSKALIDIPAERNCTLVQRKCKVGDMIKAGDTVAIIKEQDGK